MGFGVGVGGLCGHDGVYDSEGCSLLSLGRGVLGAVGFNLKSEAPVQSGVGLGIWVIYWVG